MIYLGPAQDIISENRTLHYLARLEELGDWRSLSDDPLWSEVVEQSDDGFALFIAGDWTTVGDQASQFASYCMDHDVFWVSTFGPGCEEAHDLFDRVDLERAEPDGFVVMTQWHSDQPLHEAMTLYFCAFPDQGKKAGPARIALTFGEPDWSDAMTRIIRREVTG